jgi:hypothetical protein
MEVRMTELGAFEGRRFPRTVAAIAFAIGLAVAVTSAPAQDSARDPAQPPPVQTAPEPSIYNYGTIDRTCLNWSDGCRTCSADTALAAAVCSNVGVACQPREVTCMTRRPDAEKK